MADDPELQHFSNAEHLNQAHGTIFQTLNRRGARDTFYGAKWFEPTVDAWAKVPVIYAQEHPDMDAFDHDPAAELVRIKGKIVGKVENPRISNTGHPRLMGDTRFNDPAMDAMIAAGELSLSTGFRAKAKNGAIDGPVNPHHVLAFKEGANDLPVDLGSGFLNKERRSMGDDEKKQAKGFFARLKAKVKEEFPDIELDEPEVKDDKKGGEQRPPADNHNGEVNDTTNDQAGKAEIERLQTELKNKDDALKAKDAELQDMKNKADALEKERKEAAWNEFKNKSYVPKGYLHKDNEAKTRERFEKDRAGLLEELLNKKDANPGGEEGSEEVEHKNKSSISTVGRWDAKKGEWVED
ncbi:MAG: hypothetical protein LLG45_13370 [Actinomycetia bacterium]|nr:hypothetical protein [Actinomycetes bacterium]